MMNGSLILSCLDLVHGVHNWNFFQALDSQACFGMEDSFDPTFAEKLFEKKRILQGIQIRGQLILLASLSWLNSVNLLY